MANLIGVDLWLANWLYAVRDPWLVKVFFVITMLGKWWVAAATVLLVAFIFYRKGYKKYILPFFVSVGASFITGFLGKIMFQRPRPSGIGVYIEHSWSFPSGHAILAVSLYGFLVYFSWKEFKKRPVRAAALFFGLLIILSIGFSRLYLGVHYLSDVLAGYLVGLVWLLVSIKLDKAKPVSSVV